MSRAALVIRFIETLCKTPDGAHVGKPIVLADFQKKFIRDVYDTQPGTQTWVQPIPLTCDAS